MAIDLPYQGCHTAPMQFELPLILSTSLDGAAHSERFL